MSLFEGPQPDPLNVDAHILMQAALETTKDALLAVGTPNVGRLALMVVALTGYEGQDDHPWAGIRIDEEHYFGQPAQSRRHVRRIRPAVERRRARFG